MQWNEREAPMIDEQAAQALGNIIVAEIGCHPPLLAVAISFETAQTHPALYRAYETAESCVLRLRARLTTEAVAAFENWQVRYEAEEALRNRLGQRIGDVFNTGNWTNPADPVLLDRDAIIDAWANRAFAAILDAIRVDDEDTKFRRHAAAYDHLRGTLWAAIDHARRTCPPGRFPPISFVQSFDDDSVDLITVMATRKSANP
jgi:hypothetical protein